MRLAVLVLVLLAAPAAARADDDPSPPRVAPYVPPEPPTREVSYARKTLIVDGVGGALLIGGFLAGDPILGLGLAAVGANVYAFGAPIVHFANRRYVGGFKSLGLRLSLPMLGLIGSKIGPKDTLKCAGGASCPDSEDSTIGLVVGFGVGVLAAAVIDARFLARKRVIDVAPAVAPTVGYSRAGLTFGVGGSF
jgi:hypothetical protein